MITSTWRTSRLIVNAVYPKKKPSAMIPTDHIASEYDSAFTYIFKGICLYPENRRVNHPIPKIKISNKIKFK